MIPLPLFAALALMTALAALAVLWPLSRARMPKATREADLAVYRDQLDEIARDAKAGRLPAAEAEAARIEVSRRLLAADAVQDVAGPDGLGAADGSTRRRTAAIAALVFVPAFAAALYATMGSPGLPGAPLAERLSAAPDRGDVAILVRRVEDHLQKNPNDGQGYEILAPIYQRFAAALAIDPGEPRAAYFLGLAAEQDGRGADAARIWSELYARAPAGAPYRPMVAAALARVGAPVPPPPSAPTPAVPAPATPGPGTADVAAAAQMSPQDRDAMVRGMVARLAERLAQQPDDMEGWLRLIRAYGVLGDKEKADGALKSARAAFKDDAAALARLDEAEKALAAGGKG